MSQMGEVPEHSLEHFEQEIDELLQDWNEKFVKNILNETDLKNYWARHVPSIYCLTSQSDCLNPGYDEQRSQSILFSPLEKFVCGMDEPSKNCKLFESLNELPSLCGKVFRSGEPTYSCRDCGLDLTCVLCVDCFRNSTHRFHRYKMSTSSGGGYCDCGDEEAWKTHSFCDIHHKGKSRSLDSSQAVEKLPPDIVERFRQVMAVILDYGFVMLTWEHAISLPLDLQCPRHTEEIPDTYCTVLFNDETHTYEQVIETLIKAVDCNKKAAIDFATTIDREGRSIVKCSTFSVCNQVRHVIERITSRQASKLKVSVIHTEIVAHQTFAIKLLSWLQKIVSMNGGFCHVFTNVIMNNNLLENIMLVDTQLWKIARNQYHQLFISGMLMEQNCKKVFAKVFTNNYPLLLKEFIADDHDHSISVTSLSVQIFTVPSLAHTLIQEEDAVAVLLRAFLSECERNKNEEGKLSFHRSHPNNSFRRAQYMLYDLKYLVTVIPTGWNDQLRKSFLHGVQSFFTLLGMMQGMDSVVRQVGQHIEYEAEWETGINLQLKVAAVTTLMMDWCCSDRAIFIKSFRANLKHLVVSQPKASWIGVELADHSASCIDYEVASMPVTIHLPLVRFAAGLFLHLENFGLSNESPQFQFDDFEKPSPELLMEFPLRTLVMLAQFRSGMWRRNGYSLFNQIYFYHNVRLRDEMYDRDILMMQIAASMIESNEFLIHLIYKYGLLAWADESYDGTGRKLEDDNIRQVLSVADEFLGLILIIVSERFTPGLGNVSESEKIKKEIVQLLCIEPMPHSQLFKMLPKDPNNETGMEMVVDEVAIFKKPQGSGTGKYELKAEFCKNFNPFYYHYTREEQSKAEEMQLKRKKQLCEDLCCPPPVPPEFCSRFAIIINVLQCDVMMHVMHLVLKRTLDLHSSTFSETQFEKVLHLMGVALHEEERILIAGHERSFFCFTASANKRGFVSLLEECLGSPRVESQKDLINWVIAKSKTVEALQAQSVGVRVEPKDNASTSGETNGDSSVQDRKKKAEAAAARRTRIMAQMFAMQKSFIKEHADMFKEALIDESSSVLKSELEMSTDPSENESVCFGKSVKTRASSQKVYTCILCLEDHDLTSSGQALVLAGFVQQSSVLSKNRKRRMTDPENYDPLSLPSDLFCAPHISTCGHVMHSDCWQKFFESVLRKEQRRPLRFGRHTSFDVEKNEFLCPLCERLSNTVIPIIPPLMTLLPRGTDITTPDMCMEEWLTAIKKVTEHFQKQNLDDLPQDDERKKRLPYLYPALSADKLNVEGCERLKELFSSFEMEMPLQEPPFSQNIVDMMRLFSEATYTVGLGVNINTSDPRISGMSWWACTYTIHAMEWLLRDKKKALFGELSSRNSLCLEAVIRFCGASLHIFSHEIICTICVHLLQNLLLMEHYSSGDHCCLDFDAFSLLVFLVLSMPTLVARSHDNAAKLSQPLCTSLDRNLLHLIFVFHIVQVLLNSPKNEEEEMDTESEHHCEEAMDTEEEQGEAIAAALFYQELRNAAGLIGVPKTENIPANSRQAVVQLVKRGTLPFLRCAAIFFHVLTDIIPPVNLQEVSENEYETICKYLCLPTTLDELLSSVSLKHLALSWARHPHVPLSLLSESPVIYPLSVNQLIPLPDDYSDLINGVSSFSCPNSDGDDSRNPTICLVCGYVLCSQSYCCQMELKGTQVGACTHHASSCGCGIGIFLRIRDCKILLLSDKNKGCFMAPPYVDEYGETDQGLYRGNPLHLSSERYEELHELWLSHGIPERVSHNMEQSNAIPNWQLL